MLDFEYIRDHDAIREAILKFDDAVKTPFGVKLDADDPALLDTIVSYLPDRLRRFS